MNLIGMFDTQLYCAYMFNDGHTDITFFIFNN